MATAAFQSTVNRTFAFGVIGEIFRDEPFRAESCIVNSNGSANQIGYAFTKSNQTNIASVGGTAAVATATFTASIAVNSVTGYIGGSAGSIASNVMTIATVGTGGIFIGQTITGTGVPAGTIVESFGTGTGGTGTYILNNEAAVASETLTGSGGWLNVSAVATGTIQVGDLLTATGLTGSATVLSASPNGGTGTGSTGTYGVSAAQTVSSTNTFASAAQGPGVVFAGILANPKVYASIGDSSGTLDPVTTIPDNTQAEFVTMGCIVVSLVGAFNIGDLVQYNTTTGALSTVAPGGSATSGNALVPNCVVFGYPSAASGLAAIRLTN